MESSTLSARKIFNQSSIDKLKKKKRKKKKSKEGKRSSASSASASGSPDSGGAFGAQKPKTSLSCPSRLNNEQSKSCDSPTINEDLFAKVNDCLRWPAHLTYVENPFRSEIIGKFPVAGETEEEESERIAIYKMNRRKRYLAAQQALINKYPDVSIYVSSSGSRSSSGHETHEEGVRVNRNSNSGSLSLPSQENIINKHYSSSDVPLSLSNSRISGDISRKNLLSV